MFAFYHKLLYKDDDKELELTPGQNSSKNTTRVIGIKRE